MNPARKSRRSPAGILQFQPVLGAAALCLALAGAGMGYVWNRNRNDAVLRDNARLRRQLETERKANQALEAQLQFLTRPDVLYQRARALGLVQPDPTQIIRVSLEPWPAPGGQPAAVQLANRETLPVVPAGGRP